MKILAITQARVGSTRFPAKVLKPINGQSLLEIHLKRILNSKLISKVLVATTNEVGAEKIENIATKLGVNVFKGSLENVLERFYRAAKPENPDYVVRLTSDCPFIDPFVIDKVIKYIIDENLDYACNRMKPTYPDGLDVEVMKYSALTKAYKEATLGSEQEHVTPYIWKNSSFLGGSMFNSGCVLNDEDLSHIRLTVDTLDDFEVIEQLIERLGTDAGWLDYVSEVIKHPELSKKNKHLIRDAGYQLSLKHDQDIQEGEYE